ncbi:MAG TPA: HAMP domain-containing sensor histidine kinase [Rhodanobacteraceae bacterium]|nr:HAMP domain-containing sensor histidine kinase [Rhodanobacteraceae bacterium]
MRATRGTTAAPLLRSAAFRLGALQAALFALTALVLFAVTWWAVHGYAEGQLRNAIADEAHEMAALAPATIAAEVARQVAATPQGPFYYAYYSADGRLRSGDLPAPAPAPGWVALQVRSAAPDRDGRSEVLALSQRLDNGGTLVVGRDRRSADALNDLLQGAFLWAGAAAVLLALLGGTLAARSYLARMQAVAASAARIVAGDLGARVPRSGRGDEFDLLAEALNAMLARIQSLMEGMRQVSNDIAHDLRTPLAHLRQRLESAAREADSMDAFRSAVERALADVDGVLATFAALLRIAQIESRQRRAGFAVVDLSALLTTLAGDYRPVLEDLGRRFDVAIAPDLRTHGDRALLTQLLVNLIENALRHTAAGTPITLRLEAGARGPVLSVADAGPGIPEADRARVLGRFVRLDTARSTPGSGLGLALVAAVADLHGIALAFEDNHPGLRVRLDFPPETSA